MEIDQNNENRWGYDGKEPCAGRDLQPVIQDLVPATTSWRMRMPVGRSRVLVPDPSRGTRRRWQKDCGSENPEEQKNEGASWRGSGSGGGSESPVVVNAVGGGGT
jgi:hypothetical protein